MFENAEELIFLGLRTGISKDNRTYQIALVGNPTKYENYEFFVPDTMQIPALLQNDPVRVKIELTKRGYNLVPSLVGIMKVDKSVPVKNG